MGPDPREKEFLEILNVAADTGFCDWERGAELIQKLHKSASTDEARDKYVGYFTLLMRGAESFVRWDEEKRRKLRKARNRLYARLLLQESLTGRKIDRTKIYAVTQREIEAGRMQANHKFRIAAVFAKYGLAKLLEEFPDLTSELSAGSEV